MLSVMQNSQNIQVRKCYILMNEAERTQSSVTQLKDIALDSWHNFSTMALIRSQDVLLNATI